MFCIIFFSKRNPRLVTIPLETHMVTILGMWFHTCVLNEKTPLSVQKIPFLS